MAHDDSAMTLQPGDVLLMGHQGSPIARCVRILSDSPWNHAGIVGPDGRHVIHCPGHEDPVVLKTPLTRLPRMLSKPGYGRICITAYRHEDTPSALLAAKQAHHFHIHQPFAYSMGQNGILGTLLWAQQNIHPVNVVLGAVLEQLEEVTDDVLSEHATNCTEFVWQCFDDTGTSIEFDEPYYTRGGHERDAIDGIPQAMAPDGPARRRERHPHDTPLNRMIERIVGIGRRPAAEEVARAIEEQPPTAQYLVPATLDEDVIPDLLLPRDFAEAAGFIRVATWPPDPWPPR